MSESAQTSGQHIKKSGWERFLELGPAWITAVCSVIAALAAAGFFAGRLTASPKTSPTSPPVVITKTVTAPAAVAASSPPPRAAPPVTFDGQVAFVSINFDVNPPRSEPTEVAPWTLNFYAPGLNAPIPAREAIWTAATPPTYGQCREWVTTNGGNSSIAIRAGMQLCVESAAGRIIYLQISNVDVSTSEVTAQATVWAPPQ
jgi:hypothetical protein